MKKLILAVLILFSGLSASAQSEFFDKEYFSPWYGGLKLDTGLWLKTSDTTKWPASAYPGAMVIQRIPGDTSLYMSDGIRYVKVGKMPDLAPYMKYSDSAAMLIPYLRKVDTIYLMPKSDSSRFLKIPLYTDNTLNAIVVVDGQGRTWIRSIDSLPYLKLQLAAKQIGNVHLGGIARFEGALQKIDEGTSQVNLIEWKKMDLSTNRARLGFFNAGVFGNSDAFGMGNFLGPVSIFAKKDSAIGFGSIDGVTVSFKQVQKGRSIYFRRGGMYVNTSGQLVDSASATLIPVSNYFLEFYAGSDTVTARFNGRIIITDGVNATDAVTVGQATASFKAKVSPTRSVTATATIAIADEVIFVNNPAGATTLTLPSAAGNTGRVLEFAINNSAAQVITIGGYSTSATAGGCRQISDGTAWRIISRF